MIEVLPLTFWIVACSLLTTAAALWGTVGAITRARERRKYHEWYSGAAGERVANAKSEA
jgi:hypothetical protein